MEPPTPTRGGHSDVAESGGAHCSTVSGCRDAALTNGSCFDRRQLLQCLAWTSATGATPATQRRDNTREGWPWCRCRVARGIVSACRDAASADGSSTRVSPARASDASAASSTHGPSDTKQGRPQRRCRVGGGCPARPCRGEPSPRAASPGTDAAATSARGPPRRVPVEVDPQQKRLYHGRDRMTWQMW